MQRAARILALLLVTLAPAASATVHTVNIVDLPGGDFAFQPQIVYATLGDTVRWVNQSLATHTTTSGVTPTPDGLWNSGFLGSGAQFSRVFGAMGSFRYFCSIHTTMTGLVRVTRAVVNIQSFAFQPASLNVQVGDTVVWANHDGVTHTATSGTSPTPDGVWDTGFIGPSGSAAVAMTASGTHSYFCQIHTFMTGTVTVGAATAVGAPVTLALRLLPARPNPARHQVTLGFEVDNPRAVRLTLLDLWGRRVTTLVSGVMSPGRHELQWNGRTSTGAVVSSGVYYCRLQSGAFTRTERFTWIR